MNSPTIIQISETFIKPKFEVKESKNPYYLSHWDLGLLSGHYNQKGLLFTKPTENEYPIEKLLDSLKHSLALTPVNFYPLAGQLVTQVDHHNHRCLIFVDCNKGPGVRFTHATVDLTVSDIISPTHVPPLVRSFFDHSYGEVNHDGHTKPLLSVNVTELFDGVFIGCSMNHAIVDGSSFWHFWKVWSEINQGGDCEMVSISRPPIHNRWFPPGYGPVDLFLPFIHPDEFIYRYHPPQLKERVFHFSSDTIMKLKSMANEEICGNRNKVSSFQALVAFVWRSIVGVKKLAPNKVTHCNLAANNRTRIKPPLPEEYFGNSISLIRTTTTVTELLNHGLGSTALLLHQSVVNHTKKIVYDAALEWYKSPCVYNLREKINNSEWNCTVHVGSSPRFDIYGNEFVGLGKPIAVRCGFANKFEGKVTAFPGCEGEGSVDLEICLSSDFMSALESDEQFMAYVS